MNVYGGVLPGECRTRAFLSETEFSAYWATATFLITNNKKIINTIDSEPTQEKLRQIDWPSLMLFDSININKWRDCKGHIKFIRLG